MHSIIDIDNLTNYFKSLRLLIQFAGKDLSHYFDVDSKPLMRLNQYGNTVPVFPAAFEKEDDDNLDYWWNDSRYQTGKITCMNRVVRMINTLTKKTIHLTVCEEDTIEEIQRKYYKYNHNYDEYTWRKTHRQDQRSGHLFMDKTLTENGLLYEKNEKYGLPPAFWLYFINSP